MLVDALQVNGVGVVMAEQRPKESDEEKEQKDYASDDGGFVFYKSLKYLITLLRVSLLPGSVD